MQKLKRIGFSDTNNKNIQPGYWDGIWHRKMWHAHNKKWEKTNNGRNKTAKSRKNQNAWRKGKLQVYGNIGNGHHQTNGDLKKWEKISQTNEKTS